VIGPFRRVKRAFELRLGLTRSFETLDDTRAYVRDYLLPMITAFKD
jgi:hypothetical protein